MEMGFIYSLSQILIFKKDIAESSSSSEEMEQRTIHKVTGNGIKVVSAIYPTGIVSALVWHPELSMACPFPQRSFLNSTGGETDT